MKTTIVIEFSDLRQATTRVLDFTKDFVAENNVHLRTSIAEDLSLVELDGYVFLDQFQKHFKVHLPDSVYGYVTPHALKFNGIKKLGYALTLLLSAPVFFLLYPFIMKDRREKMRDKIKRNKNRLTLGDLAATVAAGRFVKREDVNVSINNTQPDTTRQQAT